MSRVEGPGAPPRAAGVKDASEPVVSPRARALHDDALVVDLHADTPTEFFFRDGYDFTARHAEGHVDLPRLRAGGVDVQFFVAWVPQELASRPDASAEHAFRLLAAMEAVLDGAPGVRRVVDGRGIRVARQAGELAAMTGLEGGHALENSLEILHRFHVHGVRYLTLTWNNTHDWADACCSPARHGGLTAFGRQIVRELNRLPMLVDVSHASGDTFRHVLDESEHPVLASHSCARALADHPRNLSDEQLRALAANGGVIGVNFFPGFLDDSFGARYFAIEEEAARMESRLAAESGDPGAARRRAHAWRDARWARIPPVPFSRLVDHILHIASVAGIEHVALGSDFDGVSILPSGIRDAADLPRLTNALVARGCAETDVRKILGQNVLRVIDRVLG